MSRLYLPEKDQVKLAVGLFNFGLFGVKENPDDYITLKSKRKSPHYLDIRPGIGNVAARDLIVGSMISLTDAKIVSRGFDHIYDAYTHVAGTPEAATSYAAIIADRTNMRLLQPRVDMQKQTGNKTPILGNGDNVGNIADYDDVITDGASKKEAIDNFSSAGITVLDYFVVLDREEGGAPQVLEETGIEITPALGVASIAKILHGEGLINQTQFDNVAQYLGEFGDEHARIEIAG